MKKIISVLALASLGLGIASADVKFTCNYRTQMGVFSRIMGYGPSSGTASEAEKKNVGSKSAVGKAAYTSYLLDNLAYGGDSDNFSMAASNDFGGVTVRIDPKGSDSSFALNQYSGYVKFGPLTVTAGYWKDGVMNGTYQLKNDADASNLGSETFAAYKLGSMFKGAITQQVDDITGLSGRDWDSDKGKSKGAAYNTHPTGYVTYTGDLGGVELKADLAAINLGSKLYDSTGNGENTYNDEVDVFSGFAVRLDAKLETWDTQFVFKQASIKTGSAKRALAFHVQPLAWGALKATFGGALGFYNGDLTEYNADIRLRYVTGKLSITSLNNISVISTEAATKMEVTDYSKHVGLVYFTNGNKLVYDSNTASERAMWNLLAFRFAMSDKMALTCEVGDIIGFKSKSLKDKTNVNFGDCGIEAFVAPGLQIYAGKNCSISTCLRLGISNLMLDSDDHEDVGPEYGIMVPAVLRVKL